MNAKRVRRAIVKGYLQAHAMIAEAREARQHGNTFAMRAALEVVAHIRRMNSERRRALAAGAPISK